MVKLFGQARSRASRSLWMLEEIGIPYEHVPVRPYTESRSASYLRINPNGHIPSLDDHGFIIWESLAINLYLAETYARPPLWPPGTKDHGRVYQWSFWAANEAESRIVSIVKSVSKRGPDLLKELEQLDAILRVLEGELDGPYLLGDVFTVADLMRQLSASRASKVSLELLKLISRPSQRSRTGSIAAARDLRIAV